MEQRGYSLREIGKTLKRSISTIVDEIHRNSTKRKYDPRKAQHKAYVRRKYSKYQAMKIVENRALQESIELKLYAELSPEQISGRIRRKEKQLPAISKNAIYGFVKSVYGRRIEAYRKKQRWQRRKRKQPINSKLQDRTFIDQRPEYIQNRKRIGDAEADFIVSGKHGQGIILSVTDRKSRLVLLEQIPRVNIANVHRSFRRIKQRFPEIKTITVDNDILLQKHKDLERLLKVKIYFCHAYHSWEKGTIENTNGLVRRYILKGSDISKYSRRYIRQIEKKLNQRPRKCLKYDTPNEVLERHRKST